MGRLRKAWIAVLLLSTALAASPALGQRIGGFDGSRGGTQSLVDSASMLDVRAAIFATFPGAVLSGAPELTPAYLDTVEMVLLGVGFGGGDTPITPLSAAEQQALRDFVDAGGSAFIFSDNDTFAGPASDPANESLLDPFGLDTTGNVDGAAPITVSDPSHPIVDGPFGSIAAATLAFAGWYDELGPSVPIATLDANGEPVLAVIEKDALAPGSGLVVLLADCTILLDGFGTNETNTLILNSIDAAMPPPCSSVPAVGCVAAAKASLSVVEKKPGSEKLKAKLKGFDGPTQPGDLGDPVSGATRYDLCLYDATQQLAGELSVDRAGQLCGPKQKPCWKAKGDKGYVYKDPEASASGVKKIAAISGPEGKGKLQVQAGNKVKKGQTGMPTGIAGALQGATGATLQVLATDGLCFEATLGNVRSADGVQFKAKKP